jgi:arylsulfatase A-like enzyme
MKAIVYVIDCLRADHVSCYGYHRLTTPNIDTLAQDGLVFEAAFSPSTWTKPVAASLLTGLYPPAHGLRMRTDVLRRDFRTLPEMLKEHGHATLAISAIGNVSSSLGYGEGFEHFVDLYKAPELLAKRPIVNVKHEKLYNELQGEVVFPLAEDINDVLFSWLEGHLDDDFFVFVWAMDPHDPYDPPPNWRSYADPEYNGPMDGSRELAKRVRRPEDLQHLVDLYDGEIAYTDHCFGRLVAYLKSKGIYDETAIFVLGDHGEAFGDHGHMLHGHLPFEEIIRVPLINKLPGQSYAGQRISGLVSLLDVMPTVLDLADVPRVDWESMVQGQSLLNVLQKVNRGTHQIVFSETQSTEANNVVYSARTENWKYIWVVPPNKTSRIKSLGRVLTNSEVLRELVGNPLFYLRRQVSVTHEHLYNIASDPYEGNNTVCEIPHQGARHKEAIKTWLQECQHMAQAYEELALPPEVDQAMLEHLRALGYIE